MCDIWSLSVPSSPHHIVLVGCWGDPRSTVWMNPGSPVRVRSHGSRRELCWQTAWNRCASGWGRLSQAVKVTATHTSLCPSHRSVSDKPGHCATLCWTTPGPRLSRYMRTHTYCTPHQTVRASSFFVHVKHLQRPNDTEVHPLYFIHDCICQKRKIQVSTFFFFTIL